VDLRSDAKVFIALELMWKTLKNIFDKIAYSIRRILIPEYLIVNLGMLSIKFMNLLSTACFFEQPSFLNQ